MLVREVAPKDRDEWLRMQQTLCPEHNNSGHINEMDKIRRDPNSQVYVLARADDRIGDFLEVATSAYVEGCHSSPVGYIEGWHVDKNLRQQGLCSQLIWAAENWARRIGCSEIASDCELNNIASILAHSALGYEETYRLIHFRKEM